MSIVNSYKKVKKCIVAFILKYNPVYESYQKPPLFPTIIGTGFVIRSDGIIATNAHVVDTFSKVFRPSDHPKDEWPIIAMFFHMTDAGQVEIPLKVLGVAKIGKFGHGKHYYGPKEGPDLAFVHVKAKELPCINLDTDSVLEEGVEVATAGFPMGTDALTAPGWLHQLTPTLQKGIVSAVLPFSCSHPHAYAISILTQGGASGSPVFLTETGDVVGVLYGGLHDIGITIKNKDLFQIPTSISYVVPSHYIRTCMESMSAIKDLTLPNDAKSINEILKEGELKDVFEHGRNWAIKKIDSDAERTRIANFVKIESMPNDKKT